MKKYFISFLLLMSICQFSSAENLKYEKISNEEIIEDSTYKAVAYNFVYDIIFRDYEKAASKFNKAAVESFGYSLEEFIQFLKKDDDLDISDMRLVIPLGYYPAITTCDELDTSVYYRSGEVNPVEGLPAMNVRFDCFNEKGKVYDDEFGDFDTTVRVMLVKEKDGKWKIFGFK